MRSVHISRVQVLVITLLVCCVLSSCNTSPNNPPSQATCASWQIVPSPNPGNIGDELADIFTVSSDNIWASGYSIVSGVDHYLVEHWDGHAWSLVSIPTPAKKLAFLRQIVAVSAHDVWALDDSNSLLHWNGSSWNISSFPNADQSGYSIRSIAALPNGQLWLAGTVRDPTGPGPRTLIAKSCP